MIRKHLSSPIASEMPTTVLGRAASDLVLHIHEADAPSREVRLTTNKCSIGSSHDCSVTLTQPGIHPVHCVILRGKDTAVVRRWAPNAWLNGKHFVDATLKSGDSLRIKNVKIEVFFASNEVTSDRYPTSQFQSQTAAHESDRVKALVQRLQDAEMRVSSLQSQVQNSQSSAADISERMQRVERMLQTDTSSRFKQIFGKLKREKAELERRLGAQQALHLDERNLWRHEADRLSSELARQSDRLVVEKTRNKQNEHKLQEFQSNNSVDLEARLQQIASAERDMKKKQASIDSALAVMEARRATEEAALEKRAAELERQHQIINKASAKLKREIAELKEQQSDQTFEDQTKQIESLKASLDAKDKEHSEVRAELDQCREQLKAKESDFEQQAQALKDESKQLREQCDGLDEEREKLLLQVEDLSSQLESAAVAEKAHLELAEERDALVDQIEQLAGQLAKAEESENGLSALTEEKESLLQQVDELAGQLAIAQAAQSTAANHEERIAQLEEELHQKDADLQLREEELSQTIQELQDQIESSQINSDAATTASDFESDESTELNDPSLNFAHSDFAHPEPEASIGIEADSNEIADYAEPAEYVEPDAYNAAATGITGIEQDPPLAGDYQYDDEPADAEQPQYAELQAVDSDEIVSTEIEQVPELSDDYLYDAEPIDNEFEYQEPSDSNSEFETQSEMELLEPETLPSDEPSLADALLAEFDAEATEAPALNDLAQSVDIVDEPEAAANWADESVPAAGDVTPEWAEVGDESNQEWSAESHEENPAWESDTETGSSADWASELETPNAMTSPDADWSNEADSYEESAWDNATELNEDGHESAAEADWSTAFEGDGSTDEDNFQQVLDAPKDSEAKQDHNQLGSATSLDEEHDPFADAISNIDSFDTEEADGAGPVASASVLLDNEDLSPGDIGAAESYESLNELDSIDAFDESADEGADSQIEEPASSIGGDESDLLARIRSLVDSNNDSSGSSSPKETEESFGDSFEDSIEDASEESFGDSFEDSSEGSFGASDDGAELEAGNKTKRELSNTESAAAILAQMGHHMEEASDSEQIEELAQDLNELSDDQLSGSTLVSTDGEDDSIEDYMAKLLQRVGGQEVDGQQVATPAATPAKKKRTKTPTAVVETMDGGKVRPTHAKAPTKSMFSNSDSTRPRVQKTVDLEAIREIANETTRSALTQAKKKSSDRHVWSTICTFIIALLAGAILLTLSRGHMSVFFMAGIVALVVAAYFAYCAVKAGAVSVVLSITNKMRKGRRSEAKSKAAPSVPTNELSAATVASLEGGSEKPQWEKYAAADQSEDQSAFYRPEEDQVGEMLIRPEMQANDKSNDTNPFVGYEETLNGQSNE